MQSPWIAQLKAERPSFSLEGDASADVAVVGAGIAGVSTAYFLLRHTQLRVLLLDAGRIAHGATGHNAGQVVSYFERPFAGIAAEFGLPMAAQAQYAIDSAWDLLDVIIGEARLRTPLQRCHGHAGLSTLERILRHLEDDRVRAQAGLSTEPMLVKADPALLRQIPAMYAPFIAAVPHSTLLRLLQTENPSYIAALSSPKGCMNSALFCEELAGFLLAAYPERLEIAERLPVRAVRLRKDGATLRTDGPSVTAGHVVLCTNGFEGIALEHEDGPDIDGPFHRMVQGMIGYMAGYLDAKVHAPSAISYFGKNAGDDDPYVYLTRRPYEREAQVRHDLLCIGGPERFLPQRAEYDKAAPFPTDVEEALDESFRANYALAEETQATFRWHGLMGYTPSGLRCVGREPRCARLLYNLGCNGVGILPSVYGGKRIAQLLSGIHLPPSVFDPENAGRSQI